jgi:hypothetical protein
MNTVSRHLIAATLFITLASCRQETQRSDDHKNHSNPSGATTTEPSKSAVYTCPMHPEVIANAPGKCPQCDMDLVLKQ